VPVVDDDGVLLGVACRDDFPPEVVMVEPIGPA
jgi:hypothetical protein